VVRKRIKKSLTLITKNPYIDRIGDKMSKIDYLNYDDVREDRRQQKKFKKKKSLKEAKNKRRKKKYVKKDN
jgi:hypothetical protein